MLGATEQLTVNAGDHWGFTFTDGGVITYNDISTQTWCAKSIQPIAGQNHLFGDTFDISREYSIAIGYSNNPGMLCMINAYSSRHGYGLALYSQAYYGCT